MEAGADAALMDVERGTALYWAAVGRHGDVVALLQDSPPPANPRRVQRSSWGY